MEGWYDLGVCTGEIYWHSEGALNIYNMLTGEYGGWPKTTRRLLDARWGHYPNGWPKGYEHTPDNALVFIMAEREDDGSDYKSYHPYYVGCIRGDVFIEIYEEALRRQS